MKKIMFFTLIISMISVLSCSKEQPLSNDDQKQVKVIFSADAEGATKTSLIDGKLVHWSEGDAISVFDNVSYSNKSFEATNIEEHKADFEGYVGETATEYVAIYPYNSGTKYASNYSQYEMKLPYHQKAVKGGFDNNLNIMVARTTKEEMHLSFKNICALVKVTIPDEITDVASMTLMSSGPLAGRIMFEFDENGNLKFRNESVSNNTLNEVTLSTETGEAMTPGTYYFVIRPFYDVQIEDDPETTDQNEAKDGGYNIFQLGITKTNGEVKTVKSVQKVYLNSNDVLNLGTLSYNKTENYNFKVTNAPVGAFPVGVRTYQLTWTGDQDDNKGAVTFSHRNSDIATVDKNGLVTFTGKVGVAHIYVTYDHRNFPVEFNVTEGYYRETFDIKDNADKWLAASGGSSTYVPSTESTEAYNLYIPVVQGNGKYRVDAKRSGTTYLTRDFPVLCFRFDDVIDKNSSNTRNINIDSSGKTESGVEYKGNFGGANNKWKTKYKCSDGSAILIYDLSSQTFPTGGELPVGEMLGLSTFCVKYADIPLMDDQTAEDISYRMFWFNTFKTMDEMNDYLQAWSTKTGITYN